MKLNPFPLKKTGRRLSPKKPTREKPLPSGWYRCVWEGHFVVMNHRPIWSYEAADIMDNQLRKILIEKVLEHGTLPTIDELKHDLRFSGIDESIKKLFNKRADRQMHEVDFEIGLVAAFSYFGEPEKREIPGLQEAALAGKVSAGWIIQKYYSSDGI